MEELNSKDTLISLGLSSINAVELLELVEIRSGIFVPPEMLEVVFPPLTEFFPL